MSIARRSITSVTWNIFANTIYLVLALARSILLARWLPVEVFGVYVGARAFVGLTATVPNLGMGGAFLHRAPEVEDERVAADVHFTLKLIFTAVWTTILLGYVWLFPTRLSMLALAVIVGATAVSHLTQTPNLILSRRVVHRRLALIRVINGALSFMMAIFLAGSYLQTRQTSLALWALLSAHIITVMVSIFMFYVWKPVWRPRLRWDKEIARYFVTFGGKNFLGVILLQLIDRLDDLWTKYNIGDVGLGFYSRAYTFATYPRELVARPIDQVIGGTYAALKEDRLALSKAFFRTNAFLVRSSFYFGGLLFWIAPEFIHLVLTDKWMPMLTVFRLMLAFMLLDPLKTTVSRLMVSMGDAARPISARILQLVILVLGLYTFGPVLGIEGVAVAVNTMLLVGVVTLFHQAQDYVDFSVRKLFLVPAVALISAALATGFADFGFSMPVGWASLIVKTGVFTAVYGVLLLLFERKETLQLFQLRRYLRSEFVREQVDGES